MRYNSLGKTGLNVSELALGLLPMGPLQKDLSVSEGARVIRQALDGGVCLVDTAENYNTYPHLKAALKETDTGVVVATKSTATDYRGMKESIAKARRELERDVIDIFHLHAARVDESVFQERAGALECLVDAKAFGVIRAVGVATHDVRVVAAASLRDEIDVVFPVINLVGLGILGGDREQMVRAMTLCSQRGQGVYAMKALGGGNLVHRYQEALEFVRGIEAVSAVTLGMVSVAEADFNLNYFQDRLGAATDYGQLSRPKHLMVAPFCTGCGQCVEHCVAEALSVSEPDQRCQVDRERCLLCGYCAPYCPQFALRVV